MIKALIIIKAILFSSISQAVLPLAEKPPKIVLQDKEGGRVDGSPWSSDELSGKVSVVFYVAPAKKDLNKAATDAIKRQNFPRDKYASYAIINMKASFWPDWLISKKIAASQKEFPQTTYVKDINKKIVKEWNLTDNSNDVLVFDRDGKVIYSFDGQIKSNDLPKFIEILKGAIYAKDVSKSPVKVEASQTKKDTSIKK